MMSRVGSMAGQLERLSPRGMFLFLLYN